MNFKLNNVEKNEPDHKELTKKIVEELDKNPQLKSRLKELYSIDQDSAWKNIMMKSGIKRSGVRKILFVAVSVAAIMALYVGVRILDKDKIQTENLYGIERVDFGRSYVITAAGEILSLDSSVMGTTGENGIVHYNNKEKLLKCIPTITPSVINTVVVPKGENIKMELCDGSIVWINSDSKLSFPTAFDPGQRMVELEGEAYFEIVHRDNQPFIVKSKGFGVKVLGTSFNISNYDRDGNAAVTLVSGSVEINTGEKKCRLSPADQFTLNKQSCEYMVEKVDPLVYTSWIKNQVFFKEMSLKNVAVMIQRWFGVEIEFQDKAMEKMAFTGQMFRTDSPHEIISLIAKAGGLQWRVSERGHVIIY